MTNPTKGQVAMSHVREALEAAVANSQASIERHPFILDAHNGKLRFEQAERWIFCAGRESESFPGIIEQILGVCPEGKLKAVLEANLDDERGRGDPDDAHYLHYLQLLKDVGIPYSDFRSYHEQAGVSLALRLADAVARSGDVAMATGYMLINEGMTASIYGAVRKALLMHQPDLPVKFFDLHTTVDLVHIQDLFGAVETSEQLDLERVMFGIAIGERGMAALLDEAYGIFENTDLAGAA
jgi:pyrroloquinoline quinone (PQQ) biosynthesis protein C